MEKEKIDNLLSRVGKLNKHIRTQTVGGILLTTECYPSFSTPEYDEKQVLEKPIKEWNTRNPREKIKMIKAIAEDFNGTTRVQYFGFTVI